MGLLCHIGDIQQAQRGSIMIFKDESPQGCGHNLRWEVDPTAYFLLVETPKNWVQQGCLREEIGGEH